MNGEDTRVHMHDNDTDTWTLGTVDSFIHTHTHTHTYTHSNGGFILSALTLQYLHQALSSHDTTTTLPSQTIGTLHHLHACYFVCTCHTATT